MEETAYLEASWEPKNLHGYSFYASWEDFNENMTLKYVKPQECPLGFLKGH